MEANVAELVVEEEEVEEVVVGLYSPGLATLPLLLLLLLLLPLGT